VISASSFITCQHRFRQAFSRGRKREGSVMLVKILTGSKGCAGWLCRKLSSQANWPIFQAFASLASIGACAVTILCRPLRERIWDKRCAKHFGNTCAHPWLARQITHTRMACVSVSESVGAARVKSFPSAVLYFQNLRTRGMVLVRIVQSGIYYHGRNMRIL